MNWNVSVLSRRHGREADMEIDLPDVLAEVTAAFARYEAALVDNESPSLTSSSTAMAARCATGSAKTSMAHEAIMAFRAARSPAGLMRNSRHGHYDIRPRYGGGLDTVLPRHCAGKVGRQMQTWVRLPKVGASSPRMSASSMSRRRIRRDEP